MTFEVTFTAKVKTQIECAIELMSDPNKWTKYFYAVNERKEPTTVNSSDAVRFCAVGALRKCGVFRSDEMDIAEKYSLCFHTGIVDDNDAPHGRKRVIERLKQLLL